MLPSVASCSVSKSMCRGPHGKATSLATPAAGAAPTCAANIRGAFARFFARAGSAAGRREIAEAFALCDGVAMGTEDDALALAYWAQGAFDYIAMGNFPYASTYLLNGKGTLPEWPMRAACERVGGARAAWGGPGEGGAAP